MMYFKILIYIFIVIIPKQAKINWTFEEKENILNIILLIYQTLESSQIVKELFSKIISWFENKGLCICIKSNKQNIQKVFEKRMPKLKKNLIISIDNVRDKSNLNKKIKNLKSKA